MPWRGALFPVRERDMEQRSITCCRVLWIDHDEGDRVAAKHALAADGRFRLVETRSPENVDTAAWDQYDLVVAGLASNRDDPLGAIELVRDRSRGRGVVIVTDRGSEAVAVEAIRRGAADYISLKTPDCLATLAARIWATVQRCAAGEPDAEPGRLDSGHYRRMYEKCLRLLCVVGFDGRVKQSNPVWDSILGYTSDEMVALNVRQLSHPDDVAQAAAMLAELRANRFVKDVEMRVRAKDGSHRMILWNASPSVEDGVYFVSAHDITQRQVAEDNKRQSQERFELLARATNDVIWDWDLRTDQIWHNDAYRHSFGSVGRSTREVIDWWHDRIHPDDRSRILNAASSRPVDGHRGWTLEYRLRRLDGTYAHVYDRGFVVCDAQDEPTRMVGTVVDITRLKEAEAQLHESNERFLLAARATRDALWDWDIATGHVWRNEGFATLFGYDSEQLVAKMDWWSDRIHPDDRDRIFAELSSSSSAGTQQQTFHYRFRRADGTYADVVDRAFAIVNAEGAQVRMLGAMMDVSSQRRAEEIAHMQQVELAHSARVRTIGEITTGLAHELNQPLTAIANYAESCAQAVRAKNKDNTEKMLSWIEQISHNTQRAGDMLRRLRRFARKSEPQRTSVEINELVEEVLELLEAEIRVREICVRWKPIDVTRATIDRVQVQQVLVNLLSNAFEAVAELSPESRQVVLSAEVTDHFLEVAVHDAGGGIPREHRDRVFEAFFTTKSGGVGIGLAISRSIVEDHGGRIWVDPDGPGSTFRFTLPHETDHVVRTANGVRR
jgi:PAS domain S-box-containing protein